MKRASAARTRKSTVSKPAGLTSRPSKPKRPTARPSRPIKPSRPVKPFAKPPKPIKPSGSIKPSPSEVKSKPKLQGIFKKLGIYGWDAIEVPILATIVAGIPVMLVGSHGASKTDAVSKITKLVYGEDGSFRAYEAPNVQMDDLVGYPNPSDLTKGVLSFVPTQTSIWGVSVALFDELNRANPFTQSKLHELIRTKRISGLETSLKAVFSSVNPVKKYNVTLLDMALATRFMHFTVPSLTNLSKEDMDYIIDSGSRDFMEDAIDYSPWFREAKRAFRRMDVPPVAKLLVKEILSNVSSFSGRQAVMFSLALRALHALEKVFEYVVKIDDVLTLAVASVPECHSIVNDYVDGNVLMSNLKSVFLTSDCDRIVEQLLKVGYSTETGLMLDDLIERPSALSMIYDMIVKSPEFERGEVKDVLNSVRARLRLNDVLDETAQKVFNTHVYAIKSASRRGRLSVDLGILVGTRMVALDGKLIDLSGMDPNDSYGYKTKIADELDLDVRKVDVVFTQISAHTMREILKNFCLRGKVIDVLFGS